MKPGGVAFITQGLFCTGPGVSGTRPGCGISNIAGKIFLRPASPRSPSAPPAPRRGVAGAPLSLAHAWTLHGNFISFHFVLYHSLCVLYKWKMDECTINKS